MECFTVRYGSKIHKRGYDTKKLALQALGNSARKWNWDKSQMTLVDADTDAPLVRLLPQDKAKNASGMRRAIHPEPIVPSAQKSSDDPMPALLRKWLSDYAATGLPPAYLPKEELSDE